MQFENTFDFAQKADQQDPINALRNHFHIPSENGKPVIYFCGNSLGLQPKNTSGLVEAEMQKWRELAVKGHFCGQGQWYDFHKSLKPFYQDIIGATPEEVAIMNNLTVNLHLMMATFYRPTSQRYKILLEAGAFPSDYYALETQAQQHGLDPAEVLVPLSPRPGEHILHTEDILSAIHQHQDSLALVMLGGINYYTGQWFDMPAITQAAQSKGIVVGFDLAHAAGNVLLQLHDWGIDFAVWCTYKYLNSGPGGVGGAFVHQKHAQNTQLHRLAGWWGYDETTRFQMQPGFKAIANADGWQLANHAILSLTCHKAALEIFGKTSMAALRAKSTQLTAYAAAIIAQINEQQGAGLTIITPSNASERGAQLSIDTGKQGKRLFEILSEAGVVADWREPNVIRIAPTPLYNTFEEVYQFGQILTNALQPQPATT
ncbi:MAG TPA: kynureninase [Microscillaceae bacterium]|jgi:kynureninase|nr:kynureninase [Microscillaceae bacterium]